MLIKKKKAFNIIALDISSSATGWAVKTGGDIFFGLVEQNGADPFARAYSMGVEVADSILRETELAISMETHIYVEGAFVHQRKAAMAIYMTHGSVLTCMFNMFNNSVWIPVPPTTWFYAVVPKYIQQMKEKDKKEKSLLAVPVLYSGLKVEDHNVADALNLLRFAEKEEE